MRSPSPSKSEKTPDLRRAGQSATTPWASSGWASARVGFLAVFAGRGDVRRLGRGVEGGRGGLGSTETGFFWVESSCKDEEREKKMKKMKRGEKREKLNCFF